jgi:hypothetical protein
MLTRLFARISVRLDRVFDGDGDIGTIRADAAMEGQMSAWIS